MFKKVKWNAYVGFGMGYLFIFYTRHFWGFHFSYFYKITIIFFVALFVFRLYEIFKLVQFQPKEQSLIEVPLPKDFLPTFSWLIYVFFTFFSVAAIEKELSLVGFLGLLVFGILEVSREFYMNHSMILTSTQLLKLTDKIEIFDINDITKITKGEGYIRIDIEEEEHIEFPNDIFKQDQKQVFLELLEKEGFPLLDEGGNPLHRSVFDTESPKL